MRRRGMFLMLGLAMLSTGLFFLATAANAQGPKGNQPKSVNGTLGNGFTYQGQLKQGSNPVSGTCSLNFGLWDAATLGGQIGVTLTQSVAVTSGLFTSQPLDFGSSAFDGNARYLQVAAKCSGDLTYTSLSPRQPLTAAPYALFAKRFSGYQNLKVVAKSGGDFTSIQAALDSILDAGPSNPYLVYVAPGVYNETVTMKPYVDIEGAGEDATKITYVGSESSFAPTVTGADNAELRFLTVENTGGASMAKAILNNGKSPRLSHITAIARNGTSWSFGIQNYLSAAPTLTHVTVIASGLHDNRAVYNDSAAATLTDVTATGTGGSSNYGIFSYLSSITATNVTAISTEGDTISAAIRNESASAVLENSILRGAGYGIFNSGNSGIITVIVNNSHITGPLNSVWNDTAFVTRIGASELEGGAVTGGGSLKCAGVFDENYTFSASTCP